MTSSCQVKLIQCLGRRDHNQKPLLSTSRADPIVGAWLVLVEDDSVRKSAVYVSAGSTYYMVLASQMGIVEIKAPENQK